VIVLLACDRPEPEFPPGLEPLETNTATLPEGTPQDPHPEELDLLSGEEGGTYWVHAMGYVHADLNRTWTFLRTPDVDVDRRQVASWTVEEDADPEFDDGYIIHNQVTDPVPVEFDIRWDHGLIDDIEGVPYLTSARFEKVAGTVFIDQLIGSVLLERVTDEVTSVDIVEHLRAAGGNVEQIETAVSDLYASVVACANGEALPEFD